jgi:hypothetical protein
MVEDNPHLGRDGNDNHHDGHFFENMGNIITEVVAAKLTENLLSMILKAANISSSSTPAGFLKHALSHLVTEVALGYLYETYEQVNGERYSPSTATYPQLISLCEAINMNDFIRFGKRNYTRDKLSKTGPVIAVNYSIEKLGEFIEAYNLNPLKVVEQYIGNNALDLIYHTLGHIVVNTLRQGLANRENIQNVEAEEVEVHDRGHGRVEVTGLANVENTQNEEAERVHVHDGASAKTK